ncbi:DUF6519 domain-containing protein [Streptomyces alanosinicus]|uniref:Right handed beta helix domain-containing protein n=1 Tax=Streptomyces alanosinicus TaxID=68171 RepID=A0A919D4Y3_9ACTN|nr:DUF6519 domain-containing protein [Streptomyces alanosinicus]GHE08577.1 hypothetical protein GCM10010339_57870 [Streptomyces alanosinicus]
MPGDYTRLSYDPVDDFNRPRTQQGRVLLDADLNELADAVDHRLRALALDVLGPCTAPLDLDAGATPGATGFRIAAAGASFTIGLGRLYVHGLELDNHGSSPWHVERGLQDLRGDAPVPYEKQPYYPNPPAVGAGRYLVYVDAWEREVTAVEDAGLTDPAVGVDTAARMQTVWQVKLLAAGSRDLRCSTPNEKVPGWAAATAPSAGRLTTAEVGVPADTDPCSVPPDSGYRGWDNRLYRVEVHDGGTLAQATFKWSRTNASVATAVLGVDTTGTVLSVARTGRDDVERLREGAWVEVVDEEHELLGKPGFLAQVMTVDRVDDMTQEVTLSAALPTAFLPVTPGRRTRLRQWDQAGTVGTLKVADSTGGLVLEDGVQVAFSDAPAGGLLRTGDHWTFTARSADGRIEHLDKAPPQGPKHFYGRLAVIDLAGGSVSDCRTIWPPVREGGGCGDCTVCVTPESHASGKLTIQKAVDRVAATGGRVCLQTGRYRLRETVAVTSGRSVTISGHGWQTVLEYPGTGPALRLDGCQGVVISDLSIVMGAAEQGQDEMPVGIAVTRSIGLEVVRCGIVHSGLLGELGWFASAGEATADDTGARDLVSLAEADLSPGVALALGGAVGSLAVRDCVLVAGIGVAPLDLFGSDTRGLLLGGFELADSVVVGALAGVYADESVSTALGVVIRDSVVSGARYPALLWEAAATAGGTLTVRGCLLRGRPAGAWIGSSGADLLDSQIVGLPSGTEQSTDGSGVLLNAGRLTGVLSDVRVGGCVIRAAGYGVLLQGTQQDVDISGCRVDGAQGGIAMENSTADGVRIVVRDNDIRSTSGSRERLVRYVGIKLVRVSDGEVRGNLVHDIGARDKLLTGISVEDCDALIVRENTITGLASAEGRAQTIGIAAQPWHRRLDIVDNVIDGSPEPADSVGISRAAWAIMLRALEPATAARPTRIPGAVVHEFEAASPVHYVELPEGVVRVTPSRVFGARPAATPATTIRGNQIEAAGITEVVVFALAGPLLFSDNRVRRTGADDTDAAPAIVAGSVESLVASANHIGSGGVPMQVEVRQTDRNHEGQPAAAVVGNVTNGAIELNGSQSAWWWERLNVVL